MVCWTSMPLFVLLFTPPFCLCNSLVPAVWYPGPERVCSCSDLICLLPVHCSLLGHLVAIFSELLSLVSCHVGLAWHVWLQHLALLDNGSWPAADSCPAGSYVYWPSTYLCYCNFIWSMMFGHETGLLYLRFHSL